MKYQELIISPDIFNKFNNFVALDYKTYSSNLKNKKFLFDKSADNKSKLFSEIQKVRETLNDTGKMIVDSLFGDIWVTNNFVFLKIVEQNYLKKNQIVNLLINIAKYSNDKIIHSEDDELKIFLKFNQLGDEIELISFNDFVAPSSHSRLVNIPRKIRLVKDDSFILSKSLKGYLSGVKSIIIIDQYVRKFTGGYLVLKNLLKEAPDLKEIIIKTNFNDKVQQPEDEYVNREKLINSVKKITGITPSLVQSLIHDRSLVLDNKIKIRLSSGLDFVNPATNKVWRDEVSIDFEYLTNQ
jgi:hypothetical protein